MIVADTNLVAALILGGSEHAAARKVLERDEAWAAPVLWRSEFRSVLAAYLRQRDLSLPDACRAHELAEKLVAGRVFTISGDRVLEQVVASRCSAYDCEYVALAYELEVPLVTSDKEILRAFPRIAQSPHSFLTGY